VRAIVEARKRAVTVPVTVKIRLGWNDGKRNAIEIARASVDGGADALFVHGRTREARYRQPAEWDAIAEVAAAVPVPVVGNGDLLFPHEISHRLATSGCVGVMIARGALIKPWIFREATEGYWDISAEERLALYRRYVQLGRAHWAPAPGQRTVGDADPVGHTTESTDAIALDEYGRARLRTFLRWHVGFWCRYVPRSADGAWPSMQGRARGPDPRSALDALLSRSDEAALEYVTEELLNDGTLDAPPAEAPGAKAGAPGDVGVDDAMEAG
jgi:hypothetical protein